jgi:DNA-binding ferritin-like protein
MALPEDYSNTAKYVGVVIAELAATLVLYIILKIVHFCVWGHLFLEKNTNVEGNSMFMVGKQQAEVDERVNILI